MKGSHYPHESGNPLLLLAFPSLRLYIICFLCVMSRRAMKPRALAAFLPPKTSPRFDACRLDKAEFDCVRGVLTQIHNSTVSTHTRCIALRMAVHRLLNEHKRKHDLDSLVYRLLPHLHGGAERSAWVGKIRASQRHAQRPTPSYCCQVMQTRSAIWNREHPSRFDLHVDEGSERKMGDVDY